MKTAKTWAVATLTMAACWFLSASAAQAASGYVSGYLKHYQNQGNYCDDDDGRNCDGAQYLEAEFWTAVPVRNAFIYLRDQNDVIIGTGTTNTSGYYNFLWSSASMPTAASAFWTLKHNGSRFQVFTSSGATGILWFSGFNVVNGTTYAAPQNLGTAQWGSAAAPHPYTNAYDGAEKMWRNSLTYAYGPLDSFANLAIRAFSDTVPYSCVSSCAFGSLNLIQLDANAAYKPQARIMHEMGHIASYKSNPFSNGGDYCYPTTGGSGCTWSFTTAEWRAVSFEEGLATFFGDTAIYWSWSPEPLTCNSTGACSRGGTNNVESSTGTTCATGEDRWALSVDRYLRDMYDSIDDPGFSDTMARPYYEFFDTLVQFPAGTGDHQRDEPWNAGYTAIDNYDGRAATNDFGYNFWSLTGVSSVNQYTNNCTP